MTEINIKKWVHRGTMLYATDALDYDDPMHPYNQAKEQGVRPEDYGLVHPLSERFAGTTRSELINRIMELEKEIEYYARAN